jgi:microcystin-dependent protein
MAGLWQLSLTQRVDANGRPFPGAKAFFYAAETSDPLIVYAEYSLATPLPNPVIADGNGMFPAVYLDDGVSQFYRVRVSDADGVSLIDLTTLPILGIGGGGGGGGDPSEPVEATALFSTGDIKIRYDSSEITGWRICNGKTIGSATSGASYANDIAQALFEFLWNEDASLTVVGGRGASAATDWAANKRLTLPDYRGYALVGRDGMGNTAANRIAALVNLGDRTGAATVTLTEAELPAVSKTVSTTSDGLHGHPYRVAVIDDVDADGTGGFTMDSSSSSTTTRAAFTGTPSDASGQQIGGGGTHDHDVTVSFGSGTAHANVQPSAGITVYIKL